MPNPIHVCILKGTPSDENSEMGNFSASLKAAGVTGANIHPSNLIKLAWAMFLKSYLATELVSFVSSDMESIESKAAGHGIGMCSMIDESIMNGSTVHSFQITGTDTVSAVVETMGLSASGRAFDPAPFSNLNTLLIYHAKETTNATPDEVHSSPARILDAFPSLDAFLTVRLCGCCLFLTMTLRTSQFSPSQATNFLHTYLSIYELLSASDPNVAIGSLNLLSNHDLSQIMRWNAESPRRINRCLHHLIDKQVRLHPDAPAICSWDGNWTYRELDHLATKLAHHLQNNHVVGPEVLVPLGFQKSKFAVLAMLAVLKAGGGFVPLDFTHPRPRLRSIINQVEASLILASAITAPSFQGSASKVLIVDQYLLDSLPAYWYVAPSGVTPANVAFVLFTSGSTGKPKGIVQEHASVTTINTAYGKSLFLDASSRVLNFAAYTFDVSTVDVFATLQHGGCVCIPSEEDRLDNIVQVMNQMRVNWINLTPSFAAASIPRPHDVPTLETLVLAGEGVKSEHVRRFVCKIGRVINCYGPAEAGGCLANVYTSAESQPQAVGRALDCARCWIVDPNDSDRLAPIGAIGELMVESAALARGYLKDERRTKTAFWWRSAWRRADQEDSPPSRFYKTGDLVRYTPAGEMHFVGRRDLQVKIRGQRVELVEIEEHLLQDETVEGCVVAYVQAGAYTDCLVAVVQPRNHRVLQMSRVNTPLTLLPRGEALESGFSPARLVNTLARRIPAYMIPSTWLIVDSIPLNDSKKIDRPGVYGWLLALPRNEAVHAYSNPPIAPDSKIALEISEKVSSIIANKNQQVFEALNGRSFDLTAAGLDSIQIVTLSRWIRDTYGLRIPARQLTRPRLTVVELAHVVRCLKDGHELDKSPHSPEFDAKNELDILASKFDALQNPRLTASAGLGPVTSVLLTGGNGFLGIEILRQLLCDKQVQNVYVLVRAESVQHGQQRIVDAAKAASWTLPLSAFNQRVQVWIGDLSQPKLGLNDEQWDRWTGLSASTQSLIDLVIHNGAAVQWHLGYESLKASNVLSTRQLLDAMVERQAGGRFVYISGGQTLTRVNRDDEVNDEVVGDGVGEEIVGLASAQSAKMTGYSQTKIVSELLVQRCAESERGRGHVIRVVKPSYIIGDEYRGIANPGDYIWRLTKAIVEIRQYNAHRCYDWLFISDVVTVARVICHISTTSDTKPLITEILDGVSMHQFWTVLAEESGCSLEGVHGDEFWPRLQAHVETAGDQHELWVLQDILTSDTGEITSTATSPTETMVASSQRMLRAIRSNIRYLKEVMSFLPGNPSSGPKL